MVRARKEMAKGWDWGLGQGETPPYGVKRPVSVGAM